MKKPFGVILLISSYLSASPCKIYPGIIECGNGNMNGLVASGVAKMSGTNFTNQVEIFGDLNASSCKFSALQVHGNSKIDASSISQQAEIYGMLNMDNCNAEAPIKLYSNNAEIYNSHIKEILISGNSYPCIILDNSTIHGDITFKGSAGQVKCLSHCKIEGHIINGTLIKQGDKDA